MRPEVVAPGDSEDDMVQVLIRMPRKLRRAVKLAAQKDKRTVSNMLVFLVEQNLPAWAIEAADSAKANE
jgi:hypothetical protein